MQKWPNKNKKNLKHPHPWNQARCCVACWREKGYQNLQYLQKEDGADNGLLQSLLSTCFNPITSFQRESVLTKWTGNCWQTLPISYFFLFFCPALPFSHFKRQTTQFQTISVSPKYNLSRAPSIKRNTSQIIFPVCHCSYCVEKSPRNGILLFFHFTFYIKATQYHDTIAWQKLVKERERTQAGRYQNQWEKVTDVWFRPNIIWTTTVKRTHLTTQLSTTTTTSTQNLFI